MSAPASETPTWAATLVHGNDDVATATFASLDAALAWGRAEEGARPTHGSVFDDTFEAKRDDFVQHGTGYHYLAIERAGTA
ncbi:hypothetical protein [Nocardioides pakistanensis]